MSTVLPGPESAGHIEQEWAECRTTIGRFDGIIADLRKYGFSLVTLLLTASALITSGNVVADRVASSSVVIVLIVVLFTMDRYWWGLLRVAVERAGQLEDILGMQLSKSLGEIARKTHNTRAATLAYMAFVVVALAVAMGGISEPTSSSRTWAFIFMPSFAVGALLLIAVVHARREKLLSKE